VSETVSWHVGVDVGGTFTDVVLASTGGGAIRVDKVLTTPDDPRRGVVHGVRRVLTGAGVDAGAVARVVHGTTLATNVIIQRTGGPIALVVTEGFADLLRLGREARVEDDRYDLFFTPMVPPVEPELTFEVPERVSARGEVLLPLGEDAVARVVSRVAAAQPAGVAVCFLHAYANPEHERIFTDACRDALPGAYVVCSSEVWPELREYERAMTTAVCALVGPVMASYLAGLEAQLRDAGIRCPVEIMESSGGVLSAGLAARRPVATVESGGAAGVTAAGLVGTAAGARDVISFDMGGTTAKTGIVRDGRPAITHDFQVGGKGSFGGTRAGTGVPVKIPVVDLAEVGAGGGSIAWLDGGVLRVGPRSAGAVPGPACYGRGGAEPTVTDANLVLGYLDPAGLAGGVTLSPGLAADALERVAEPLDTSVPEAARAIHEVVNATMAAAIRVVTVQRGIDPREFTLVGFGGAGPMHAARLAQTFGIPSVVVPWGAGVASAVGLISSDPAVDLVQTHVVELARADPDALEGLLVALAGTGRRELGDGDDAAFVVTRSADLRYVGQAHQLTIPIPGEPLSQEGLARLADRFRDHYRATYGIATDARVELVNARVRDVHMIDKPPLSQGDVGAAVGAGAPAVSERPAYFAETGGFVPTPVFDWAMLEPDQRLVGPVIVQGPDATIVVPPGHVGRVHGSRNVILTRGAEVGQ